MYLVLRPCEIGKNGRLPSCETSFTIDTIEKHANCDTSNQQTLIKVLNELTDATWKNEEQIFNAFHIEPAFMSRMFFLSPFCEKLYTQTTLI